MKAIVVREFGPPQAMVFETMPDPEPPAGHVAIRVGAGGVHWVDTAVRAGRALGPFPLPPLPYIPGREVAGTVERLGADIDSGWLGARVAVSLGNANGGYAELAVAPVGALHRVPDGIDDIGAVTMVGTGRTAAGIVENADLTDDDVVVVPAAAGGLGSILVQLARSAGARVIGLAGGTDKVDLAYRAGADLALDYSDPAWPTRFDARPTVLLDGVGGAVTRSVLPHLADEARILVFGQTSGADTELDREALAARSITIRMSVGAPGGFTPANIHRWADVAIAHAAAGRVQPVTTVFPLADAAAAHEALLGRRTVGKVVLR